MTVAHIYLGLISGTSVDGIDAALLEVGPGKRGRLLHAATYPFDEDLRRGVLGLIRTGHTGLGELGRIDAELGAAFAAAARALLEDTGTAPGDVRAIGSHGQTVWHAPDGRPPSTQQIGDPSVIAARTGLPVVADFRRLDIALGGQGAPLVPPFHAAMFADDVEPRVVINLGGIANLTVLGAGAARAIEGDPAAPKVIGFDSGPAGALCDAWIARELGLGLDAGGTWARGGTVHDALLQRLLAEPYFAATPPKSTGKERFNLAYVDTQLGALGTDVASQDVQATLVELTARSVADAVRNHAPTARRALVCGGGAHNAYLMERIAALLGGVTVETTAAHGLDPDAVEAAAFAWLASRRLAQRPNVLASVTGARRDSVGGAVYAPA